VPPELEAICLRAMQHEPGLRLPTAGAFAGALRQWLADGSLPAGVAPRPVTGDDLDPNDHRGRYEVVETLLRGSFETVQRARDRFLRCDVLLKRAGPGLLSPNLRRHLRNEAARLMRVQHPAVLRLRNVYQDGDDLVLVMDALDGAPLAARLRQGPVPAAEVLRWFATLCDAVDALHQQEIVHCCLGPDTVWLTAGGDVCVTGFTFARDLKGSTISTLGFVRERPEAPAPAYVAPEQRNGRRPDARADVFALGCLLYRCLTGRDPDLDGRWPPSARVLKRALPAALAAVVATSTQPAAQQRYNTVRDLAAALQQAGR
jgi:serine/threonine protein kinase